MSRPFYFGFGLALIALFLAQMPFFKRLEHQYGLGALYSIRGPIEAPPGAIIVAIDKGSLDWLRQLPDQPHNAPDRLKHCLPDSQFGTLRHLRGPSSLPRPIYACLLKQIKDAGFALAVLDVLFATKSDADIDELLAEALRVLPSVILIGFEQVSKDESGAQFHIQRAVQPREIFRKSAAASGTFILPRTLSPAHGFWRRPLGFENLGSLPLEALTHYHKLRGSDSERASSSPAFQYFWLYGPPATVEMVPLKDFVRGNFGNFPPEIANNTVVFVGAADSKRSYYTDSYPAMFSRNNYADISGVELAATVYLNGLSGVRLTRLPEKFEWFWISAFAFFAGCAALANRARAARLLAFMALTYFTVAVFSFLTWQIYLPILIPVLIVPLTAYLMGRLVHSEILAKMIKRLAPEPLIKDMLRRSNIGRGTVLTTDATVLFFDLIKSTSIGENLPELEFADLINKYNDAISEAVRRNGGHIVAFTGDGASVLFDSSDIGREHPQIACQAAIQAVAAVSAINENLLRHGGPKLGQRIGINSGRVAVGAFGAEDRFSYSMVGDTANLASRLEKLGKTLFPEEMDVILVGQATHARVDDDKLRLTKCGTHAIPGRTEKEKVFRLNTMKTVLT